MKKLSLPANVAVIALFVCVFTARLAAQDDPAPKVPLIPRASDRAAWTVTYRYKPTNPDAKPGVGNDAKPPDQINTVQVQKTGNIYHRIISWTSGAQSDAWNIGQRQVSKDRSALTYVLMPSEGPATDDYSKSDFEDIAWISMSHYAGYKKGEQPVFVFQAKNTERPLTRREKFDSFLADSLQFVPADTKPQPGSSPVGPTKVDRKLVLEQAYGNTSATVVLDARTQLPVAYDDGRVTWAYQFTTAPAETLVPPPAVVKILRQFDDYIKGITLRPSKP